MQPPAPTSMTSVDLEFDSTYRHYNLGDTITGRVVVTSDKPVINHQHITVTLHGAVEHAPPQRASTTTRIYEQLLHLLRPTTLIHNEQRLAGEGKLQLECSDSDYNAQPKRGSIVESSNGLKKSTSNSSLSLTRSNSNTLTASSGLSLNNHTVSTAGDLTVSNPSNKLHPLQRQLQQHLASSAVAPTPNKAHKFTSKLSDKVQQYLHIGQQKEQQHDRRSELIKSDSSSSLASEGGYSSAGSSTSNTLSNSKTLYKPSSHGGAPLTFSATIPFSFELQLPASHHNNKAPTEHKQQPTQSSTLYETYHGLHTQIAYYISIEIPRGFTSRTLKTKKEIYVLSESNAELHHRYSRQPPFKFMIQPTSLQNVHESSRKRIPDFIFDGYFLSTNVRCDTAIQGEIVVKRSAITIKSIDLQLVRVETAAYSGLGIRADSSDSSVDRKEMREASEIMTQQIADGHPIHNQAIPIHLQLPRWVTCPTLITPTIRVEFEVNVVILLHEGYKITENFPIQLYR